MKDEDGEKGRERERETDRQTDRRIERERGMGTCAARVVGD